MIHDEPSRRTTLPAEVVLRVWRWSVDMGRFRNSSAESCGRCLAKPKSVGRNPTVVRLQAAVYCNIDEYAAWSLKQDLLSECLQTPKAASF